MTDDLPLTSPCVQCSRPPTGPFEISWHGQVTCLRHKIIDRCAWCTRPRSSPDEAGWRRFAAIARCPTCAVLAVEDQADVRRLLPRVRAQMAELGIRLQVRVKVTLVYPGRMVGRAASTGAPTLGLTHRRVWPSGRTESVGVDVVGGLPSPYFGATVAHELGHCWLSERGATGLDRTLEEGVCELFATAWLKKQRTPFAAAIRRSIESNEDPVYGTGYRMVRTAVERVGIRVVLDGICLHGRLP